MFGRKLEKGRIEVRPGPIYAPPEVALLSRRRTALCRGALGLVLAVGACKSATDACDASDPLCGSATRVPTTVTLSPSMLSLTTIGETQQVVPTVLDQNGQAMAGVAVTWRSDDDAVASVSSTGLVQAEGNGSTTVHATVGSTSAAAGVSVADPCVSLGTLTLLSIEFAGLAATDCTITRGTYADFWTLSVTESTEGRVQIDLISSDFDAYIGLLDASGSVIAEEDDSHFTGSAAYDLSAHVDTTLAAGTYTIVATSFDVGETGAYQLSVGPGLLCPEEGVIVPGTSTTGQSLAVTDCSYGQYYADVYVVRVPSTTPVTFTLTSTAFDAYLTLLDPSGNILFDDDNGGGGTDARISQSLAAGWYVVEVSSFNVLEVGAYTLTAN